MSCGIDSDKLVEQAVGGVVIRSINWKYMKQGNAPEHNPALGRSSERLETAESLINFDFLGRQQQLMRNQQSGMQQSQPRQQYGLSDVPAWQQQLMFTQLQQLQKQRQFQRLDQEARQPNAMSQLPSIPKQETGDQLPVLVSSTPVHDTSNYMWPNEHMGGASKVPNSSQMFMMGNMNWPQRGGSSAVQGVPNGVLLSNEPSQMLRSMGVIPQQLDQSLYGSPVASARGAFNQYSQSQGMSQDSADMLARTSGSRSEKPLMQSSSLNKCFHGDQSALFSEQVSMQDGASEPGFPEKVTRAGIFVIHFSSCNIVNNYGRTAHLQKGVQQFRTFYQPHYQIGSVMLARM